MEKRINNIFFTHVNRTYIDITAKIYHASKSKITIFQHWLCVINSIELINNI